MQTTEGPCYKQIPCKDWGCDCYDKLIEKQRERELAYKNNPPAECWYDDSEILKIKESSQWNTQWNKINEIELEVLVWHYNKKSDNSQFYQQLEEIIKVKTLKKNLL